jgi:hypothetical protein
MGSGLDGVTDVALVMANAMSRLVEERPELKDELDAMQQRQQGGSTLRSDAPAMTSGGPVARPRISRNNDLRDGGSEERGGRRRRRRRRRGKRVDWAAAASESRTGGADATEQLLDQVASVLSESGPRSLHVRQIAETLAGRGVLGGEISEIERAVTAAVLLDTQRRGRASRFSARGDARYQLQGARLPEPAAKAEQVLRDAIGGLETETNLQLVHWLGVLGARALESLVRIYLQREGYPLVAALPPGRGVGKLVVEDSEDEEGARMLVLVVPKRTGLDTKLWDGDLERNACGSLLVFAMGDQVEEFADGNVRVVGALELAQWLRQQGLGVQTVQVEVCMLDPVVIESIAGLDT